MLIDIYAVELYGQFMVQKYTNYTPLHSYLERREISPQEAIKIIEDTTPEVREDNKKLIWKMKRFSLYLWERIEQEKKGYLWTKKDTCKNIVKTKNFKQLYESFNFKERFDPIKEERRLFKLTTDPRQKIAYFKSRFFVYKGKKEHIPQKEINRLVGIEPVRT
mgnify:CR=1 FL=1